MLLQDISEQMPDIKKRNRDPLSDDTYKANRNSVFIRENPKEYCPIVDTPKKIVSEILKLTTFENAVMASKFTHYAR